MNGIINAFIIKYYKICKSQEIKFNKIILNMIKTEKKQIEIKETQELSKIQEEIKIIKHTIFVNKIWCMNTKFNLINFLVFRQNYIIKPKLHEYNNELIPVKSIIKIKSLNMGKEKQIKFDKNQLVYTIEIEQSEQNNKKQYINDIMYYGPVRCDIIKYFKKKYGNDVCNSESWIKYVLLYDWIDEILCDVKYIYHEMMDLELAERQKFMNEYYKYNIVNI